MQFLIILGALFAPILLGSLLRTAFGPLHHRRQKALSLAATTGGATGIATVLVTLAGAVGAPTITLLPILFAGAMASVTLFGVAAAGE
jgi:hypothetical protein